MSTATATPKPRAVRCSRKGCTADMADMRADALWCSPACRERVRRGESAHRSPMPQSGPSGLQVSRSKGIEAVVAVLQECEGMDARRARALATAAMNHALSDRQRARLQASRR